LADHLRLQTTVLRVGKEELLKGDLPGQEDRGDWSFRLLVRNAAGEERVELADAVLDCTGVFRQPNWLGQGGIPAAGEAARRGEIEYRLPDVLGRDRERYAGKHTLLIGAGSSAATSVVALAELAKQSPGTRVTWVTRREGPAGAGGPIEQIADDRLPQRAALARRANALASDPAAITYWPTTHVESIGAGQPSKFRVALAGRHAGVHPFDEIIANVGFQPDRDLYRELQVHEGYASEGPQTILNPEPNFYLLGAKSYGRQKNFLLSVGLDQIREVFTIIGDRPALDLYASAHQIAD
jgi:hypothetical protein